ncbi:MAG TPA: NADH-quinone oxidoreductase subunit C [Candidatus Binataceae bacterium]|jgi:NADH-quinone oxidoreductase subunit C|nr:NADH-quinone oxidoreductase subunit C [Candidatus Binataceae bacterium]
MSTEAPPSDAEKPQLSPLMVKVNARLAPLILEHREFRGDDRIHVARENILAVAGVLRDDPELAFDLLLDVTAIDYYGQPDDFELRREVWDRDHVTMRRLPRRRNLMALPEKGPHPRFAVVYHLISTSHLHRLRIKCRVPEDDPRIASLTPVWPGANWLERETWDLYGIRFEGHPDLRRIYLYDEFEGHPLRKDYGKLDEQPIQAYVGPGAKEPRRPE